MKQKSLLITILLVVIFAAGGFCGGMQYQKNKKPGMPDGNFPGAMGSPRAGSMGREGADNSGEIISKDDKSVTIKSSSGSTKVIYYSESTQVAKTEAGSKDSLATGTKIMVIGSTNSDGSITARNIQIQQ